MVARHFKIGTLAAAALAVAGDRSRESAEGVVHRCGVLQQFGGLGSGWFEMLVVGCFCFLSGDLLNFLHLG